MRFHIEQAELEHRKEANWAGSDDDYVSLDSFAHVSIAYAVQSLIAGCGEVASV
jgi:hypothetical protein